MQHSELVQKDQATPAPPKKKVLFKCGLLSVIDQIRSRQAHRCYNSSALFGVGVGPSAAGPGSFVLQVGGADVDTLPMLPALVPLAIVLAPILSARSISRCEKWDHMLSYGFV